MRWRGRISRCAWAAVLAVIFAAGGFIVGRNSQSSNVITSPGIADASPGGGTAYIGADQPLNRQPSGFAYTLPSDVTWIDSAGTIHDGSHPSCLPYYHAERVASMDVTMVPLGGGGYTGTVILVRC